MPKRRSVALLVETSNEYGRGLLEGVLAYNKEHTNWSVFLTEQGRGAPPPKWLENWSGDGLIARVETEAIANAVQALNLPVVDLSAARQLPGIPWVETDDEAIARLALEHFSERGFKHLAYAGDPSFEWSNFRCEHFVRLAEQKRRSVHIYQAIPRYDSAFTLNKERQQLSKWLKQLPRPIAIFACYDHKGQHVLDVCRSLDIAVPEEVAVLGVDNDRLLCEFASTPLSSIIPDTQKTGYEAAELLEQMMSGHAPTRRRLVTSPLGVKMRESTDTLAIDDHDVAVALRYIRDHAHENIRIADVLKQIPLSRRVFENRFIQTIGRTPHDEILRLRINRLKELLTDTHLGIGEMAKLAGYEHPEYMAAAFKRETGLSPSEYRSKFGSGTQAV